MKDIYEDILTYCLEAKEFSDYIRFLCPFHDDTQPSCFYNKNSDFFFCFGCNKKGNGIILINKLKNIDEYEISDINKKEENIFTKFIKLKNSYINIIKDLIVISNLELNKQDKIINKFIKERKIKNVTLFKKKIGFINDNVIKYFNDKLKNKIYSRKDLLEIGLFYFNHLDKLSCFFSFYLIFPFYNFKKEIVGIGGKYILKKQYKNLKNNILFKKKTSILTFEEFFNFDSNYIIICEGYFDLFSLFANNYYNVISLSGVAISEALITFLKKKDKTIILCLDNDQAGIQAIYNISKKLLNQYYFNFLIVNFDLFNDYKDIDECIQNNHNINVIFERKNLLTLDEFLIDNFKKNNQDNNKTYYRSKLLSFLFSFLIYIKDMIVLEDFFLIISNKLKISIKMIKYNFFKYKKRQKLIILNQQYINNNKNINNIIFETINYLKKNNNEDDKLLFYFLILLKPYNFNNINILINYLSNKKNNHINIENYINIISNINYDKNINNELIFLLFFWITNIKQYINNQDNIIYIKKITFLNKLEVKLKSIIYK